MRSAHAGACFVRVGRCRFGSILGSILESFWESSSPLYSFWGARVATTGSQKRGSKRDEESDENRPYGTSRDVTGTGSGGPKTINPGHRNQEPGKQVWALETLHYVLWAWWRISSCFANPATVPGSRNIYIPTD